MGKGYLAPYYARITMLLFPGLCVLVGIALNDLQLRLGNKRRLAVLLTVTLLLTAGASVLFDAAYGRAMQQKDARQVVREDLQNLIGDRPAKIGVLRVGAYFYTAMPAAKPLNSERVVVQLQDPGRDADFFLVGFPRQVSPAVVNATVRQIEAHGKFEYAKSYRVPVSIFGHEFRLTNFPLDMTYTFPTLLLFRAKLPHELSTS
jgi:hypothetical protein